MPVILECVCHPSYSETIRATTRPPLFAQLTTDTSNHYHNRPLPQKVCSHWKLFTAPFRSILQAYAQTLIDSHQNPSPFLSLCFEQVYHVHSFTEALSLQSKNVHEDDKVQHASNKQIVEHHKMIRNSTRKFQQKYAYSSLKNFDSVNHDKEDSESSYRSVRFNTTQLVSQAKSTPKLQSSKKNLFKTQPLISNSKKLPTEQKHSFFTDHASIATIQTVMKKKGIEESQVTQHRPAKMRRINRNSAKVREPETFIESLPKNTLFFCCECYQYIFDIEKNRHFPDCKDQLNMAQPNIGKIGIQRLQKIVQLANYTETNTKQINELFNEFTKGAHKKLLVLDYPKYSFFTLGEITYAFVYIYSQLLKNVKYESDSTIFSCF